MIKKEMSEYKIPLRNKNNEIIEYSFVDEEDYENVNNFKWNASNGYVSGYNGLLHRFVMNAKTKDPKIDHINGNKLDNRKSNLRFVTASQNAQNRPKKEGCSSKYIGVSYNKNEKKWTCNCSKISYMNFDIEEHAAYWYDILVLQAFGKDAKINGINKPIDFIEPIKKEITKNLPSGVILRGVKYYVQIKHKRKTIYLGNYDTIEEAENVFNKKRNEINEERTKEFLSKDIIVNKDNIAIIITSKGDEILVDNDKYFELLKYSWNNNTNGYAQARINGKKLLMHRYLLNAPENEQVDHINCNKLDNRLKNLRLSNSASNGHNKLKRKNLTSEYIGVSYDKKSKKYVAQISKDKIKYRIGFYESEEEAAKFRDKKAVELYGSHAKLNFK